MRKKIAVVAILVAGLGLLGASLSAMADEESYGVPPGPPAYLNADGTVNEAQVPEFIPAGRGTRIYGYLKTSELRDPARDNGTPLTLYDASGAVSGSVEVGADGSVWYRDTAGQLLDARTER